MAFSPITVTGNKDVYDDAQLDPLGNATRAECATMIMKLITNNQK